MKLIWDYLRTWLLLKKKQFIQGLIPVKNRETVFFVILAAPRSGSTWLHTFLNNHPQIFSYGEQASPQHIHKNIKRQFLKIFSPHHVKAVGIKVLYEHLEHPYFTELLIETSRQHRLKIIHLKRENQLEQLLSLRLAQRTGIWSSVEKNQRSEKIHLAPIELKAYIQDLSQRTELADHQFHGHQKIEITYENLVKDTERTLEEVQHFLEVKPRRVFSLLRKQHPHSQEYLLNYKEISAYYETIRRHPEFI